MLKKVRSFLGVSISMLVSLIMLMTSAVVCMLLLWLQMWSSAATFFVFGVGIYWYARLLKDRKPGIWYEMDDMELKK